MKKIFVVKEVETNCEGAHIDDTEIRTEVYCYGSKEKAEECLNDLYKEKIMEELGYDLDDEEDLKAYEDDKENNGYLETDLTPTKAYLNMWSHLEGWNSYTLEITEENLED